MVGIKYKLQNDDPKKCPCCDGKPILLVLPCGGLPINVCQRGMVALVSDGGMECVRELDSDFNPTEPLPE